MKSPSEIRLVQTTLAEESTARTIARRLVERRLAACVNVGSPVTSTYRWDGDLHEDEEIPLTIKTGADRLQELLGALVDHHPYDCPEILVFEPDATSEAYARWVSDQVEEP